MQLALTSAAHHPTGRQLLEEGLAYVAGLCRPRNAGGAEVTVDAMATQLERFPIDVALQALKDWPERNHWFPTWAELRERCEALEAPRRAMLAAITWTMRHPPKPAEPRKPEPTGRTWQEAELKPQPAAPIRTREEQLAALNAMATGA